MQKKLSFILTLLMIFVLTACSAGQATPVSATTAGTSSGSTTEATATSPTATNSAGGSVVETLAENGESHENAEDYTWDSASAVSIVLNGDSISAEGSGVTVDGSKATITAAGTYILSGSLTDGQIIVNTKDDAVVRLVLNGVDIRNSNSAPIYSKKAEKMVIILAENTQNALSDAASYDYDDAEAEEPNAAIFSKGNLSIAGSGSLSVQGNFNDGISSKDGLVIAGGAITVTAQDDGIRGKDYLVVKDGSLTVNAQGDGLKADNAEEPGLGYIDIEKSTLNITAAGDAIAAETDVVVADGQITLTTGGGTAGGSQLDGTSSAKGIKGVVSVTIDGGSFTINSADDALHSNGSITVNGGSFTIAAGDDGMHADSALTVNNGEIHITESYEGLESTVITINNGTIHLLASDDGVNVASGNDGSGGMRPGDGAGQDAFAASGSRYLYVHGGYLYVDANGDGIDVNGAIEMTGGTVLVNGPTEQMNGPLDYDAGFNMTGGFLVAVGSSGMAMAPDENSSQYSLLANFDSAQAAGSLVHIQNSAGEDLLTFAPTKQYQSVAFSSPELVQGEGYKVFTIGSSTGSAQDGLYQDGVYTAGSEISTFSVTSPVTRIGSGGMGGPGGMGPGRGGPGGRRP